MSTTTDTIITKLRKAGDRMATLRRENEQLRARKASLELELAEKSKMLESLTEENNRIRLAKTLAVSPGDKTEMKFRVNELVREIDKCIAMLNR